LPAALHPLKVVAGAFVVVLERWQVFARALGLPFAMLVTLALLEQAAKGMGVLAGLLGWLRVPVYVVFAIVTHRLVLLGPPAIPPWGLGRWTRRETLFALHLLGMCLCAIPAFVLGLGIGTVFPLLGAAVGLCAFVWSTSRLALVFPGIAIDQGVSFGLSWKLTANYQWPMVVIFVLYPLLLGVPAYLLARLPEAFLLAEALDSLMTVFTIAALSLAYREIRGREYGG